MEYVNPVVILRTLPMMQAEIDQIKKSQFKIFSKLNNCHYPELPLQINRVVKEFCFGGDYSEHTVVGQAVPTTTGTRAIPTIYIDKDNNGYMFNAEDGMLTFQSISFKVEQLNVQNFESPDFIGNDLSNPNIISCVPPTGIFYVPVVEVVNQSSKQNVVYSDGEYTIQAVVEEPESEETKTFTIPAGTVILQTVSTISMTSYETSSPLIRGPCRILRNVSLTDIGLPNVIIRKDYEYQPSSKGSWKSIYYPMSVYGQPYVISNNFTTRAISRDSNEDFHNAAGFIMEPAIGGAQYVRTLVINPTGSASGVNPDALWYPVLPTS